MDELVLKSMARWPNVPDAFGWLELDGRGTWRLKGERISNAALVEFINRNYEHDAKGRWFFQNGPQRVYVRLQITPYVVRAAITNGAVHLATHTHKLVSSVQGVWFDEQGRLILGFNNTAGVIDDRDLTSVLTCLGDGRGPFESESELERDLTSALAGSVDGLRLHMNGGVHDIGWVQSADLPGHFGFDPDPRPAPGQTEC